MSDNKFKKVETVSGHKQKIYNNLNDNRSAFAIELTSHGLHNKIQQTDCFKRNLFS